MTIRTDHDVISALEALMEAMEGQLLSTASMRPFFAVGEWLLCFEGAWILAKDDPDHPLRRVAAYRELETYFAEYLI